MSISDLFNSLERFHVEENFVPNDTYATEGASFQVITGVSAGTMREGFLRELR